MNYWLLKSEPNCFSIQDLKKNQTAPWDGVRNHQAKKFIGQMRPGDLGFFYHSSIPEAGIVGIMEVKSEPFLEKPNEPWLAVQVAFREEWPQTLTLKKIKEEQSQLTGLLLLQKGLRLSVIPVSPLHWEQILSLSKSSHTQAR